MRRDYKLKNSIIGINNRIVIDHGSFVAKNSDEIIISPFGSNDKLIAFKVNITNGHESYTNVSEDDKVSLIQVEREWNDGNPHSVVGEISTKGPENLNLTFDYSI